MSKFTKGEWRLDPLTGEVRANGGQIAKVYGVTEFNHTSNADECMANARLILNAPEMYGDLVQVVNDYDLDPDLEGDIMWMLKEINGGQW